MFVEPFLDTNIINEINGISINAIDPKYEKDVLKVDKPFEGACNGYYTILYVKNEYLMYYRANSHELWISKDNIKAYETEITQPTEMFCIATSNDGLNFVKKNYNIITDNILKHDVDCHNFFPYFDNKQQKFIGISGTNFFSKGMYYFESIDGIKWNKLKKILDETYILPGWRHPNHFDSHNTIIYNDNEQKYYIYLRDNNKQKRKVQYTTTKDFITFNKCININTDDNDGYYTFNAFKYPNSEYILSMPTVVSSMSCKDKKLFGKKVDRLLISKNYVDWKLLRKNLFSNIKENFMGVNGIVSSIDNNKLYIYLQTNYGLKNNNIQCFSFEKDRLQKLTAINGYIITNKIKLNPSSIHINFQTNINGTIMLELFDINKHLIAKTIKYTGNHIKCKVVWNTVIDSGEFYIKFILIKCNLFSFYYDK